MAKADKVSIAEPTAEQQRHAQFEVQDILDKLKSGRSIVIGKAYRKRRMLETLAMAGLFSDAECKALANYRHAADGSDRSPMRDSLARPEVRAEGGSDGAAAYRVAASLVAGQCEAAAGSLAPILRAIIVDDMSLSAWAIHVSGSIEVARKGRRSTMIEPKRKALDIARLDIQMAAKRVEAELGA